MKWFRKNQHCLFVEEEVYNWAPARKDSGRHLGVATLLLLAGVLLFILLA